MNRQCFIALLALATIFSTFAGCVRRTLTIRSNPPHALVYLNDEEVGRTPVQVDFVWYGDYDVVLRADGYRTLKTNLNISRPWHQNIPFDFFTEVLYPFWITDTHEAEFTLEVMVHPTDEDLINRATALRDQAMAPTPIGAPTAEDD